MIFNFYTYLFLSSMAAGAAMALLLQILLKKERRKLWDSLSSTFLIYIIIGITILPLGLVVTQWTADDLNSSLIFYLLSSVLNGTLYFFIKDLVYPIVAFALLGLFLFFHFSLGEFTPFSRNENITFSILQIQENETVVELVSRGEETKIFNVDENTLYPDILKLHIQPYIFVLPDSHYYKILGLKSDSDNPDITNDLPGLPGFIYQAVYLDLPGLNNELLNSTEFEFLRGGIIRSGKELFP